LLRLYAYTNEASYREKAKQTLELYADHATQHGIFAATYGLAVTHLTEPRIQVVVMGKDDAANELWRAARQRLSLNTAVVRFDADKAVAQNLPPALAETIPHLPAIGGGRSFAVVCAGFACQPPVFDAEELARLLDSRARPAA